MNVRLFADALAGADADDQATFFTGFFETLKTLCREGRHDRFETQLAYITEKMPWHARELLLSWGKEAEYQKEQEDIRRKAWAPTRQEMYELESRVRELKAKVEQHEDS